MRPSRRKQIPGRGEPAVAEKLRILTVITKLELGGAQQVALHTLRDLPEAGYTRFLIAGAGGLLDPDALRLSGIQIQLWKSLKHPIRPFWDAITWLRLVHFIRREKIQIVHTHSSKAGWLGRLAARVCRVKVVLHTVHGWPFHEYQPAWLRNAYIYLERWAARAASGMIAVSEATRQKGLQNRIGQPAQYHVIWPGSELESFSPGGASVRRAVRKEFGFPPNCLVVGMVACLKPQKAPLDFVRAAARVGALIPQAGFILVGDGELRQKVEAEIHALGLEKRLKLAGWRRDVNRLMSAWDIFALSSLWEGLPCVLAQAQASGLPIVATRVEGSQEAMAEGRIGYLVPPGDPERLSQRLAELLGNSRLRRQMGRAGILNAARFGLAPMVKKIDRLYQTEFFRKGRNEG